MAIYGKIGFSFDKARATVVINQDDLHGKITASTLTPLVGETVRLIASMDNGYALKEYQLNSTAISGSSFNASSGINTIVPIEVKTSILPKLEAPIITLKTSDYSTLTITIKNPNSVKVGVNINGSGATQLEAGESWNKAYSWQSGEKSKTYTIQLCATSDYLSTYNDSDVITETYTRHYDTISLKAPLISISKTEVASTSSIVSEYDLKNYKVVATFTNSNVYDCILKYNTTGSIILNGSVDLKKNSTYQLNLGTFENASGIIKGYLVYDDAVSSSYGTEAYKVGNQNVVQPVISYETYGDLNTYKFTVRQVDNDATSLYYNYDESSTMIKTTSSQAIFTISNNTSRQSKNVIVKAFTYNSLGERSATTSLEVDIPGLTYLEKPVLNESSSEYWLEDLNEGYVSVSGKILNNNDIDVEANCELIYEGEGQMENQTFSLTIPANSSKAFNKEVEISQPNTGEIIKIHIKFVNGGLLSSEETFSSSLTERK